MNQRASTCKFVLAAAAALSLCAVVTFAQEGIPSQFVHPKFDSAAIDKLYLLRGVDLSMEAKGHGNLDRFITKNSTRILKKKRYVVEFDKTTAVTGVTQESLAAPSADWIKSLGPAGARWVALFVIQDSAEGKKVMAKATCEMDIYVVDRVEGIVLYRSKQTMAVTVGFMFSSGMAQDHATFTAVNALSDGFPKKGEKPAISAAPGAAAGR